MIWTMGEKGINSEKATGRQTTEATGRNTAEAIGGKTGKGLSGIFGDIGSFIALYLLNFILLAAIFYFLDGFGSIEGLLYFFLLSSVFLLVFLVLYGIRKRKQYRIEEQEREAATREREKSAAYEKRYQEHLLFINRWVHYIKTPLSVVRSITQEAVSSTEGNPDGNAKCDPTQALLQIQEESDRILDGVNSALNFARATDFVTDFKIEQFDLREMFVELINDLKMNFIRSHIYPDLKVASGTLIYSDRKWLKFIFFQLLTNAIKYSYAEGKVSIYREGNAICVSDTGIGIAKEDLPRIFDIFYTGTTGRTRGESTGIGLYLVKTICDKLDYSVTATSTPGHGTTIAVRSF